MQVSRGGYYAHRRKPEGARRQEDSMLRPMVAAGFAWPPLWTRCLRFAPPSGQPDGWLSPFGRLTRRVLGWAAAPHMRAELVTEALQRTRFTQSGQQLEGVIAHSNRGSQYTSAALHQSFSPRRMNSSMSRTANCYDNATMESFSASLKAEALYRIPATRTKARLMIHDCIDAFYNTRQIHASIAFERSLTLIQPLD